MSDKANQSTTKGAAEGAAQGAAVAGPWGAIIGGLAGGVGGMMGADAAAKKEKEAQRARERILAMYSGIELPDIDQQRLALEDYQSAGTLTPEMEAALNVGPTSMEGIAVDPRLQQNQMDALAQVAQIADQGVSDADKATLELIRRQAAGEAQAKSGQILQQMQARGQGGSGAELIAQLQNAQSSADRMNQQALEEARMMQQARMAALQQQGNMAGTIRGQDYSEQSDLAKAKDAINAFNVQNRQNVGQRNVSSKNQAQQSNIANQQAVMNQNTGTHNTQQQYNRELLDKQYQNQMQMAAAKAGQYNTNAAAADRSAANIANQYATIGQGLGQAVGGFFSSQGSNNSTGKK